MKRLLSALFLLCPAFLPAQQEFSLSQDVKEEYLSSMHKHITSEKLFGYVKYLSDSTLFEGRLAGSEGMARANRWVASLFEQWGLEPFGTAGSTGSVVYSGSVGSAGTAGSAGSAGSIEGYYQSYPHPCVEVNGECLLEILFPVGVKKDIDTLHKTYPWADGWFAGGTSASGDITAEIVYAGFGVSAPELGYDDYKGIDVKGKIVLIEGETPNSSYEKEDLLKWYPYTLHQYKVANAVAHGAIGMLYNWVPGPNNGYDPGFVYAYITSQVAEDVFKGTGKGTFREHRNRIVKDMKPSSFNTGKYARIKMSTVRNENAFASNIVGIVRGSDPVLRDEYVIVSGHLDHLGMIPYHIAGANDNNSSTAVLLGVAEALAKSSVKPKRSVIFMSIDGEEANLTGSTYYVNNPLVPKDKVVAILNLEQVGIGERINLSHGVEYDHFIQAMKDANDDFVHRKLSVRSNRHITRPRTDGAVFMKADYPCVDIGAGGGAPRYYHHPDDDWDTINPETLEDVAEFVFWSAIYLGNR